MYTKCASARHAFRWCGLRRAELYVRACAAPCECNPCGHAPHRAILAGMSNKKQKKPVIENPVKRLIVVGSPRVGGRCGALANLLFEACIEDCPTDEVYLAPVSELSIAGCTGCDWCKLHAWEVPAGNQAAASGKAAANREAAAGGQAPANGEAPAGNQAAAGGQAPANRETEAVGQAEANREAKSGGQAPSEGLFATRCCQADDMADIYPLIEDCDELVVVAPVYFAGLTSQLKALLDRMQPYFWNKALRSGRARRRPLTVHVVGEGGDPWGYEPLLTCIRSAFGCAGFRLERVLDWVGKIDEAGEIVEEAKEIAVQPAVPGKTTASAEVR